ncbi:hypothetical protein BpHYR1_017112, partial [Brachionus plicatilis]
NLVNRFKLSTIICSFKNFIISIENKKKSYRIIKFSDGIPVPVNWFKRKPTKKNSILIFYNQISI